MVLVSSLAKFKQLPDGFGFEFWEIQPLAKHFWYYIVENTAQRFCLESCEFQTNVHRLFDKPGHLFETPKIQDQNHWAVVSTTQYQRCLAIYSIFGLVLLEFQPSAKHLWSCVVETTAQRFWSWIVGISTNCPSFVWCSWTFVWNSQDSRPKPLGSGFNYAIPKVFGNLF